MHLETGTYRIQSVSTHKMVGLHADDDMTCGGLASPIYADEFSDPTWMLQELNNGKYLIKPKAAVNILAGTQSHDLFAFREEKQVAGDDGPCVWTITETDNEGIFEITKDNSSEGWTVRNDKINVAPLSYSDKNKFEITLVDDEEMRRQPEEPGPYETQPYEIVNY
ncbi:hypothetical protein ABW20_dc0110124 [Dactylellina cionopaga]|nr:hypothetical protein ABW20_dc0110124 [Dactylellina cionopaga]